MKTFLIICLGILSLLNPVFGQDYDSIYGKPLIVLMETDPWLMVIGSDVPTFALYENGQIIYKSIENNQLKIYEVTLSKEGLRKVIESLEISDSIYSLDEYIEASDWTDLPSNILILNLNQTKTINVYGVLREDDESRGKTPQVFLTVYDNIIKYKNIDAHEWLPEKIEIMFWDYNYAPNKRPWIKGFPDLNSPSTIKHDHDFYCVFISKVQFEEFKKYYSTMGEKEAVLINKRKMAMSYRLPFPNLK